MDWLNALQAALFVAVLVAGAVVGLQQGSLRTLRGIVTDVRGSRDDFEKERDELRHELDRERTEKAKQIADLEGAVRTLTNTVTAKDAIDEMRADLNAHHVESMAVLTAIRQGITDTPSDGT